MGLVGKTHLVQPLMDRSVAALQETAEVADDKDYFVITTNVDGQF